MKKKRPIYALVLVVLLALVVFVAPRLAPEEPPAEEVIDLSQIPEFSGVPFVVLAGNTPEFTQEEKTAKAYEFYSELDGLNRCGYAMACIGRELMPTEDRGSIGQIKPSGWQTAKYDFVDGKYLYNRCHLIGFQLTGENANESNLITGTRYMNVEGMLPFENMVADYIKETDNHVLYRVTPIFQEDELVARGVVMEAWSVEDNGEGVCFYVYVYNNQPGVVIDYVTGLSSSEQVHGDTADQVQYILNTSSKKFHTVQCSQGQNMKEDNRQEITASRENMLAQGYTPAGCCNP